MADNPFLVSDEAAQKLTAAFPLATPEQQPRILDALEAYRDQAPIRAQAKELDLRKTFLDPVNFGLSEEKRQTLDLKLANTTDPEGYKSRLFNEQFLASRLHQPLDKVARNYAAYRDVWGKEVFGMESVDDKAFFSRVGADFKLDETLSQKAVERALKGEPPLAAWAETGAELQNDPAWNPKNSAVLMDRFSRVFMAQSEKVSLYRDTIEGVAKELKAVMGQANFTPEYVDFLKGGGDIENDKLPATARFDFEGVVNTLLDIPEKDRPMVLQAIAARQTASNEGEATGARMARFLERGLESLLVEGGTGVKNIVLDAIIPDNVEMPEQPGDSPPDRIAEYETLRVQLRNIGQGIAPIEDVRLLGMNIGGATQSLPMTLASLAPYVGVPLMVGQFRQEGIGQLMTENPGMSQRDAEKIATFSAPIQALTEVITDRLLFGKLPAFEKFLNSPLLTPSGIAGRLLARGVVGTGTEVLEENLQKATPLIIQEAAAALNADVPGVDWDSRLSEFKGMQGEVLATAIPLVLLGGGVGTISDYRSGKFLIQDGDALVMSGYSPEIAAQIQAKAASGDVKGAELQLRQGAESATPEQRKTAAIAFIQKAQTQEKAIRSLELDGTLASIRRSGEKWTLSKPDGMSLEFPTFEQADSARWADAKDRSLRVHAAYRDIITQMDRNVVEGQENVITFDPALMTPELAVDRGYATKEQIQKRVSQSQALDEGKLEKDIQAQATQEAEADGEPEAVYAIFGMNHTDEVGRGVIRLFQGATPQDLIEEIAEIGIKRHIIKGGNKADLISKLRATEAKIQEIEKSQGAEPTLLFRTVNDAEITDADLIEAFSHLSKAYYSNEGQKNDWRTHKNYRRYTQMLRSAVANSPLFSWIKTLGKKIGNVLQRAAMIDELRKKGDFDGDLEKLIRVSLGLESQAAFDAGVMQEAVALAGEAGKSFSMASNSEAAQANEPSPGGLSEAEAIEDHSPGVFRLFNSIMAKHDPGDLFSDSVSIQRPGYKIAGYFLGASPQAVEGYGDTIKELKVVIDKPFVLEKENYTPFEFYEILSKEADVTLEADNLDPADQKEPVYTYFSPGMLANPFDSRNLAEQLVYRGYDAVVMWDDSAYEGSIKRPTVWIPYQKASNIKVVAPFNPSRAEGSTLSSFSLSSSKGTLDARLAAMFDPFQKSPEMRRRLGLAAKDRVAKIARDYLHEIASPGMQKRKMEEMEKDRLKALSKINDKTPEWVKKGLEKPTTEAQMKAELSQDRLLGWLRTLNAAVSTLPAEIRGKIIPGGSIKIASLKTNEARLKAIEQIVKRADAELEKWLRKDITKEIEKTFEKYRPERKSGEKPKGKLDPDVQQLVDAAEAAMSLDDTALSGELARIEALLADPNVTPEQEVQFDRLRSLVELFGDWKNADAARMSAALDALKATASEGWAKWKVKQLLKREERQEIRAKLRADTGKSGVAGERDKMLQQSAGIIGKSRDAFLNLSSFSEALRFVFGQKSKVATAMIDAERVASNQYEDAIQEMAERVQDYFTDLAGGVLKGEQMRYDMSRPKIEVQGRKLSELQSIQALLMWQQEDGKRHMEGPRDENGQPLSDKWSYDQAFIDELTSKLPPRAMRTKAFLETVYGEEYDPLNALYRERHGVSLPKHALYAPITVAPQQAKAGEMTDPVSGAAISGSILTPGALRSRNRSAVAEPRFEDALATMLAHHKQMRHWMAYYDFSVDAQAVLGNRDVMNSAEAAAGKEAVNMLRKWVDAFAQGGIRDATAGMALTGYWQRMANRAATVGLLGRVSTLLVQSTQLAAASVQMPTGAYMLRFSKLITGQLAWTDAVKSDFIQRRIKTAPPIVRQAMANLGTASRPNQITSAVRFLGNLLSGADGLFTGGTYAILLDYHRGTAAKLGLEGAEAEAFAHQEATRATEEVAQPVRMGNRSMMELTMTNPFAKAVWAYSSEARQKIALFAWATQQAKADPARFAKTAFLTFIVGGLMSQVIKNLWREMKGDDDERKWSAERLMVQTGLGPLHGVPLISELSGNGGLFSGMVWAKPALEDIMTGKGDARDVETVLSALGYINDNLAGIAALSHLGFDSAKLLDNAFSDEE